MDYFSYTTRKNYALELIEKGGLSSPHQLTERFECSERTIRRMINNLREEGHQIQYDYKSRRYLLLK